jgi:hypothetical protein
MATHGILAFKNPRTGDWLANLGLGGVRVRYKRDDGSFVWVKMSLENTKIANPEHDPNKHAVDDPKYPRWISLIGRT